MIGYLEGRLLNRGEERILLLVSQVGYEVMLPAVVMEAIKGKALGENLSLYIFHYQTERQPKPVLIGFTLEAEREFFQLFISVEAIGPLKAVKALNLPVGQIARAIEARDVATLKNLRGIGERTARKIIATLEGKMGKFALIRSPGEVVAPTGEDFQQQVVDVLISQLGYGRADARAMVTAAMKRNRAIATPEELFEEVYRGAQEG
ncbi:MAG TPA: Holliday junction branch migration protein RuvA [Desulfobacterales bacterium]|jgi:holliday junction DNA helicase RuvA|nr:Holliday junction branch migration protein RuvA [Desulfobacterales bacterium]